MNLFDYFCKRVRLIDIDDKEWEGYVSIFTPKQDTDDELYDEIAIDTVKGCICFNETEIKSIEIIKAL